MARRNPYEHDVDFAALALQSPAFNKHLKSNGQLDFSNPEAVQQLTKSLLERDFGLHLDLPADRLCPPVPNRLNYVLWIQDLLDTSSDEYADRYDPKREIVGLDIGTGASCIYPLLACCQRPQWKMAATEIDEKSLGYARRNILQNSLKSRIRPFHTIPTDPLIPLDALGFESIDFTMCNPPFYESSTDLVASAASKSRPPLSACTGAEVEMVTPGGEVAFVNAMVSESKILRDRCQWYTSMLGKYSSVEIITKNIRDAGIQNFAVKDLVQGNKTKRWAVAWSWGSMRPTESVARGNSTVPKHFLPFSSEYKLPLPQKPFDACARNLNNILQDLNLQWRYRPALATGVGFAKCDVWSRAARRKRQHESSDSSVPSPQNALEEGDEEAEPALGFKIRLTLDNGSTGGTEVIIRWLQGRDSVLFESFCGMLKRQLTNISR